MEVTLPCGVLNLEPLGNPEKLQRIINGLWLNIPHLPTNSLFASIVTPRPHTLPQIHCSPSLYTKSNPIIRYQITSQYDYSYSMLFLRKGKPSYHRKNRRALARLTRIWIQVTGDLWERYLKLIDGGMTDGLVDTRHVSILERKLIASLLQWCHGPARTQEILLPSHDYDTRGSDREATEVRLPRTDARFQDDRQYTNLCSIKVHTRWTKREEASASEGRVEAGALLDQRHDLEDGLDESIAWKRRLVERVWHWR